MTDESKQQPGAVSQDHDDSDEEEGSGGIQSLLHAFAQQLGFSQAADKKEPPITILESPTFEEVIKYIKEGKCKNVIVLTGAGVSTSAGIPDFRSPGSGLYSRLQKYNLPHPQAIFEIGYFKQNPQPFFDLAKELYPGSFKPTPCHYLIRLLHDKGLLLRLYTQNIDNLDRIAGIPEEKLVEAHGSFHTSHCVKGSCREQYTLEWMKEKIFADEIPKCTKCGSFVKPDIVFFGENLPEKFYKNLQQDFKKCDLALVMGTSLAVQPFASLIEKVPKTAPRLLINREKAGTGVDGMMAMLGLDGGMRFDAEDNFRDVAWLGSCDDGSLALAEGLGWADALNTLVAQEHEKIDMLECEKKKKTESQSSSPKDEKPSASDQEWL